MSMIAGTARSMGIEVVRLITRVGGTLNPILPLNREENQ